MRQKTARKPYPHTNGKNSKDLFDKRLTEDVVKMLIY